MIDTTSYILDDKNFYREVTDKKYIVIGNTFNLGMNHFKGWKLRLNGGYKKTSNFTVNRDGKIYKHFDPIYYSDFLQNSLHNKKIISILLENEGWFDYDIKDKNFINYFGNPYSGKIVLMEKRWRNHTFWDNYSDEQTNSLIELVNYLVSEYKIEKKVLSHNTYVRDIHNFEGVTYRSNWIKDSTDLSPSFNFQIFKEKVENHGIQ